MSSRMDGGGFSSVKSDNIVVIIRSEVDALDGPATSSLLVDALDGLATSSLLVDALDGPATSSLLVDALDGPATSSLLVEDLDGLQADVLDNDLLENGGSGEGDLERGGVNLAGENGLAGEEDAVGCGEYSEIKWIIGSFKILVQRST